MHNFIIRDLLLRKHSKEMKVSVLFSAIFFFSQKLLHCSFTYKTGDLYYRNARWGDKNVLFSHKQNIYVSAIYFHRLYYCSREGACYERQTRVAILFLLKSFLFDFVCCKNYFSCDVFFSFLSIVLWRVNSKSILCWIFRRNRVCRILYETRRLKEIGFILRDIVVILLNIYFFNSIYMVG